MTAVDSPNQLKRKTKPRLSIILATRNAAVTVGRCLDSIIKQSYDDWELLIADGASTDETTEIIRQHERYIVWWQSRRDNGIYDAWNQALAMACGEYVTFLGADDAWHTPSILMSIFNTIGDRTYDLVTGRGVLINPSRKVHYEFGAAWNYHKVMRRVTVCHPGALHRRELFQRYGNFNTSYRICADYEFLLRLPEDLRTLHLDAVLVDVADAGISRQHKWLTLHERYRAQANCPRVGKIRAIANYADKLWRVPIARVFGIPTW